MNQKDRELILKDLTARLRYGVKILHETWNYEWDQEMSLLERVVGIDEDFVYVKVIDEHNGEEYREDRIPNSTFDDKMFLRPISSMTEEEEREVNGLLSEVYDFTFRMDELLEFIQMQKEIPFHYIDWFNSHHFDYRGLIEKGLALEAPEGMYN